MEKLTDEELILKAKGGNKFALEDLMRRYKHMASKICKSYFLIGAEYDDLLQEAMIGLFNAYQNYDSNKNSSFSTFAYTCITRRVQTAIKSANCQKNQILNNATSLSSPLSTSDSDDESEISLMIPSNELTPDESLMQEENLTFIKQNIQSSLSKMEYKVLYYFLNGDSYTQIAQKLNTDTKSVDNALSRARSKLSFLKDK